MRSEKANRLLTKISLSPRTVYEKADLGLDDLLSERMSDPNSLNRRSTATQFVDNDQTSSF